MKIPGPEFGRVATRPVDQQYQQLQRDDGTDTLVRGLGALEQGLDSVDARAARAREKAIAAASDAGFAQAQDRTTKELFGYDEAPESKPEGTTSLDTLTIEDLETAGGPGKHVSGYLDSRGNDAYERATETTERLQKYYDSLLSAAPNEETRQHLSKRIDALKATVHQKIAVHESEQLKVAELASSKSLQDSTVGMAANLFNDDQKLAPYINDAVASIKRTVLPEEFEAKKTEFLGKVSKAMVGKYIAAGDLKGAEQRVQTDAAVLGEDAAPLMEIITRKQKAAEKDAAELTTQAIMDRTARKLSNPYGFIAEANMNKLRDEASARYPENKEEAMRTAEEWIHIERERKKAIVGDWINQARIQRRHGGTRAITKDLISKIENYGEDQGQDFLDRIAEDDRRAFDRYEAKAKGKASAAAADKQQKYLNKLALTRMKSLPWNEQAEYEQKVGFEGQGLDDLGRAQLQEQQRKAMNLQEKGFGAAKEALDNDIEKATAGKVLKGEDPSARFEIKADAADDLAIFIEQNKRAPTADERAEIVSKVALRQATKPRVLDSIRGPGMEFPFQQQKREGASKPAPSKLAPGRYESKSKPGTFFVVDAQGNKRAE